MKKIGAILFYAVMLAAVFAAALTILSSAAAYDSANGKAGRREFKNTIEANLGDGNTSAKVTLIKKAKRDYANFDIVKDAKLQIESAGKVFTEPINYPICYNASGVENLVVGNGADSFIAVSSCVPQADGNWKLILYSFDGKSIAEELKVTSNEPSIEIKDSDDGSKDIVVMDRDYGNNPDTDKFITTYKYVNGKWQRASLYRTKTKKLKTFSLE